MTTTNTAKTVIAKEKSFAFGKDVYLLGKDSEGTKYWLEAAKWDCGWYWGFGYVETYTNNSNPAKAKDIQSHTHIDSSFMGKIDFYNTEKGELDKTEYIHNIFNCPKLICTSFDENEGWVLSELFKTFYTLKKTSEMYHTGGSHVTTNPLQSILKNEEHEKHINAVLLPKVFEEIYKILSPTQTL